MKATKRGLAGGVVGALVLACAIFAAMLCMPATARAEGTTFQVGTSDEYKAAVDQINTADAGEFTIELTADVNLDGDFRFTENTTTILGAGHVLSGGANATVLAEGSATVRLGSSAGSDALTLRGGSGVPAGTMVSASGSAKVEMYTGTTITGHSVLGSDAAVSLSGSASFEMFGGKISDCKDAFGQTAGGVGVGSASDGGSDACTFKMHGGSIEGCSGGYGAGVRVGEGGTFVMDGGKISGCTSSGWGGGVYATRAKLVDLGGGAIENNTAVYGGGVSITYMKDSPTSFFHYKVGLSGVTIAGNEATYGGGVSLYNVNTPDAVSGCTITDNEAQVGGGVMLWNNSQADFSGAGNTVCNNTATSGAADFFLNTAEDTLKLFDAAAMGETYRDSGKVIDGWYIDDPSYVPAEGAEPVSINGMLAGEKALVASYKVVPTATVTIDLGDGSATTTDTVNVGGTIESPADPVREGYRFAGWYADGSDVEFDFTQPVTADVSIRAHWVRLLSVVFDDGAGNAASSVVDEGAVVAAPAAPVRAGYRFLGWYAQGASEAFDFTQPVTADVQLVAKWEKVAGPGDPENPGNPGGKPGAGDPTNPGDPAKPGNGAGDKPSNDDGNAGGVDDNGRERVAMIDQSASTELPPTGDAMSFGAGFFAFAAAATAAVVAAVYVAASLAVSHRRS